MITSLIDQQAPERRPPLDPRIQGKRTEMQKAFGAWMKEPEDADKARALYDAMTDYEVFVRLQRLIPEAGAPDSSSN